MSEQSEGPYTPSETDVRFAYIDRRDFEQQVLGYRRSDGEYGAEFDAWLAERDRQMKALGWAEGSMAGLVEAREAVRGNDAYQSRNPYKRQAAKA